MGCGQWFCTACLQPIKDVPYCKKCAETVGEDFRSLAEQLEVDKSSPGYIRTVTADAEDRWEKGFRSSQMIPVTRRRLKALKHPVDLSGAVAGIARRAAARAVDIGIMLFTVFGVYALAAGFLLVGPAGPAGGEVVLLAMSGVAGLCLTVLLRSVFLAWLGQTIGRLVAGIRIVNLRGVHTGPILSFGRALFDTVFDVLVLPHLVSLFMIRPARKRGSLGDTLVGTQTVHVTRWRVKAQETIYEEDRAKLLGAAE